MTTGHTPTCPCGWTGKPQSAQWKADANLRQHQSRASCPVGPPERQDTDAAQRTRNARLAYELSRAARLPDGCTALTGTCECTWCAGAACDRGAPLGLRDGTWVLVRGVRKWVAA